MILHPYGNDKQAARVALGAAGLQTHLAEALPLQKLFQEGRFMGILHVFIRFCLLYDNQFLFRLENNPEGGACVTIGASIHESEV